MDPFLVTLQLPIHLDDNTVALYLRPNTPLPIPPHAGYLICGWNIPPMRGSPDDVSSQIYSVIIDGIQNMVLVGVLGCHMGSMNAQEMLEHLGAGWQLSRIARQVDPPAAASEPEDCDDGGMAGPGDAVDDDGDGSPGFSSN